MKPKSTTVGGMGAVRGAVQNYNYYLVYSLGSEQTSGSEVRDNCPDRGP